MGYLKMLLNINNAEGARESIRLAYQKHFRLAQAHRLAPHSTAMFGALSARWKMSGRFISEPHLWAEIAPFVCMAPETGREALAEYVVCIERPQEGRIGWLREQLNSSLIEPYDSEQASNARDLAAQTLVLFRGDLHWAEMIRDEVLEKLRERARDLPSAEDVDQDDGNGTTGSSGEGLLSLEGLAFAPGVPVDVFALNDSPGDVLANWSKAELLVLNGRIGNFRRNDKITHLHAALGMLSTRLRPLLPDVSEELDPESFKAAILKHYGDR